MIRRRPGLKALRVAFRVTFRCGMRVKHHAVHSRLGLQENVARQHDAARKRMTRITCQLLSCDLERFVKNHGPFSGLRFKLVMCHCGATRAFPPQCMRSLNGLVVYDHSYTRLPPMDHVNAGCLLETLDNDLSNSLILRRAAGLDWPPGSSHGTRFEYRWS